MSANYPQIFKEYQSKIFVLMKNVDETLQRIESRKQDTSPDTSVEHVMRDWQQRLKDFSTQYKALVSESNRHSLRLAAASLDKWLDPYDGYASEVLKRYPYSSSLYRVVEDWKNLCMFAQPFVEEVLTAVNQIDAHLKGASPQGTDSEPFAPRRRRGSTPLDAGLRWLEEREAQRNPTPPRETSELEKIRDFYLAWYYRQTSEADQALIMQAVQAGISQAEVLQEFLIRDYNRRNQAKGSILEQIRRSQAPK
jgi:hypothetical protein